MGHACRVVFLVTGATLLVATACGGVQEPTQTPSSSAPQAAAPAAPESASPPAPANPAPAMGQPAPGGSDLSNVHGGNPSAPLTWTTPSGWTEERPTSPMRKAQYRVPGGQGAASDGELAVFFFGPGQGGDTASNAARWASQFRTESGSVSPMKTVKMDVSGMPVLMVEVMGTYDGGMAMGSQTPTEKPGYMLLGAIVEAPGSSWFFKFTGPEKTVRAQKAAFESLVRSVKTTA